MIKEIGITYGLPGSGKTRWAEAQAHDNRQVTYLETDNYLYKKDEKTGEVVKADKEHIYEILKSNIESLKERFDHRKNIRDKIIIDGLFTTNDSLESIIKFIKKLSFYKKGIEIRIVRFNGDVETCLWNDKGRFDRFGNDKNAKVSIMNLPLEEIDLDRLKILHKEINIFEVSIEKKPLIKNAVLDNGQDFPSDEIVSEDWTTGGNWENCWETGGDYDCEEPVRFRLLDDILKRCNAEYLYDEAIEKVAYEGDDSESDYYGGCRQYSFYSIQLENLNEFLKERGHLRNLLITDLVGDE